MSRFPDRIIVFERIGGKKLREERPSAPVKKVKLYEKLDKETIKQLILKKQRSK